MEAAPIAIDMDNVIVDFIGGVGRILGIEDLAIRKMTHWSFQKSIGIPDADVWKRIFETPRFWVNLDVIPAGDHLIKEIEARGWDWYFMTDPGRDPRAPAEKVEWALHYYGKVPVICPNPRQGGPGKGYFGRGWLIDDKPQNIDAWEEAGGKGIGWWRLWNNDRFMPLSVDQIIGQIERMGGGGAFSA